MPAKSCYSKSRIHDIQPTDERFTSRAGLTLFQRYIQQTSWPEYFAETFSYLRRSAKGIGLTDAFEQMLAFWMDGTGQHLTYFDDLKSDEGYAAGLQRTSDQLVSSHPVKRLFGRISFVAHAHFRPLLQRMFLWRLRPDDPDNVVLGMDTMVMDNDQALKREGSQPPYRGVKGFQPFQITWNNTVVDAVFRGGAKHSNHGETVLNALRHLIPSIRRMLGDTIPIIVRFDSGFFDQTLLDWLEDHHVGYVGAGKAYEDLKEYVQSLDTELFERFGDEQSVWEYVEFGDRRFSWERGRRVVFTRPICEDDQYELFPPTCSFWYTNLGMGTEVDEYLRQAGAADSVSAEAIIEWAHGRGREELTHRHVKDFGWEQLPFKRFESNMGWYYVMVMAFNLFEAFKEDVGADVFPDGAYPTTIRRRGIDVAGKGVSHAGKTVLKIVRGAYDNRDFAALWQRVNAPPAVV